MKWGQRPANLWRQFCCHSRSRWRRRRQLLCWPQTNAQACSAVALLIVFVARISSCHQDEPISANEIGLSSASGNGGSSSKLPPTPTASQQNFSQISRDVTHLRLVPELRSVKLRWNYQHNQTNVPASFSIRYCELTSWMSEIKCRHKELRALGHSIQGEQQQQQHQRRHQQIAVANDVVNPLNGAATTATNNNNNSVISQQPAWPLDIARQPSEAPDSEEAYEAHIFDLRALTNYTFNVRVARFSGEPPQATGSPNHHHHNQTHLLSPSVGENNSKRSQLTTSAQRRHSLGRKLDFDSSQDPSANQLAASGRIETKPFGAEASKCFANTSEVLINTGRYFGGRISVEGASDSRCHLLGNKSSEQSVYLFTIDHQLCRSKLVDGDRIESMVLVHENKDILTHNTARFLVLCNVQQKSFTVRASVSLPQVNSLAPNQRRTGQSSTTRPALIQPLYERPNGEHATRLGSMPGFYRPTRADPSGARDLDTNESRTTVPTTGSSSFSRTGRQSKASSLEENSAFLPPRPVDVASKVLYVERADPMARSAKLLKMSAADTPISLSSSPSPSLRHHAPNSNQPPPQQHLATQSVRVSDNFNAVQQSPLQQRSLSADELFNPLARQDDTERREAKTSPTATESRDNHRPPSALSMLSLIGTPPPPATTTTEPTISTMAKDGANEDDDSSAPPLLMTNNHRVAGDFLTMAQVAEGSQLVITGTNSSSDNYHQLRTADSSGQPATIQPAEFSIKYSPASVAEYPVGRAMETRAPSPTAPAATTANAATASQSRSRSGRMRPLSTDVASAPPAETTAREARNSQEEHKRQLESRMGDMLGSGRVESTSPALDLLAAETSPEQRQKQQQPTPSSPGQQQETPAVATSGNPHLNKTTLVQLNSPTLAHNITGALLRWSLRALGNLARKSLESLANNSATASQIADEGEAEGESAIGGVNESMGSFANENGMPIKIESPAGGGSGGSARVGALANAPAGGRRAERAQVVAARTNTGGSQRSESGGAAAAAAAVGDEFDGFLVGSRNLARTKSKQQPPVPNEQPILSSGQLRPSAPSSATAQPRGSGASNQETTKAPRAESAKVETVKANQHQHLQAAVPRPVGSSNKVGSRSRYDEEESSHASANDQLSRESAAGPLWPLYTLWTVAVFAVLALIVVYISFFGRPFQQRSSLGKERGKFVAPVRLSVPFNMQAPTDCGYTAPQHASEPFSPRPSGLIACGAGKNGAQLFGLPPTEVGNILKSCRLETRHKDLASSSSRVGGGGVNGGGAGGGNSGNPRNCLPSPINSPASSQTTRSTSAASTSSSSSGISLSGGNYCRNNEGFAHNEHVILQSSGLHNFANESFA